MLFMIEMMMFMVFTSILGSMAIKSTSKLKEIVTEAEMELVVVGIEAYEIKKNALPTNLNALSKSFKGTSYKQDAWENEYTYSTVDRELCSINNYWGSVPNNKYCVSF